MLNRLVAPKIKNPNEFEVKLQPYRSFNLKNGVPVYTVEGGAEDVLKIEWVFKAGKFFEKKRGIAPITSNLLKSGTSKKTAYEISQHVDFFGSFLSVSCSNKHALIRLQGLQKHLGRLLPLVAEIIADAVFPEEELEIYKQNSLQRLKVNMQHSDFVADRELKSVLYGPDHPYGLKLDAADIKEVEVADLRSFYNNYYRNGECKIFASGKLPSDFENQMNLYFGDLSLNNKKVIPDKERVLGENKKNILLLNNEGVQSSIRVARAFPGRLHPDYKKAVVLNVLLGGYFGSRLMTNIREDKGYTYGIYSYLDNHLETNSWVITTEAGKHVREQTIEEVYRELDNLKAEPASNEELKLVRNYLMGIQLAALDGPFRTIDQWKSLVLNDLPEDYFNQTIQTIKTVTTKELQDTAIKYFNKEDFYEVVAE